MTKSAWSPRYSSDSSALMTLGAGNPISVNLKIPPPYQHSSPQEKNRGESALLDMSQVQPRQPRHLRHILLSLFFLLLPFRRLTGISLRVHLSPEPRSLVRGTQVRQEDLRDLAVLRVEGLGFGEERAEGDEDGAEG